MTVALKKEDFASAAHIRDELKARGASGGKGSDDGHWEGIGAPEWLGDRLKRLGFPAPLEVQRKAMHKLISEGNDAVIVSCTGSGKTLAYFVPALALMDFEYFEDYYLNQAAELEDLKYSSSDGATEGAPQRSHGPPPVQTVVVVPTFELGAQACLTAFKLLGGNISTGRRPGDASNMYTYRGPKGVDVSGMFSSRDVLKASMFGSLEGTQILVGTPRELQACALERGCLDLSAVRVLVVDELDACMEQAPEAVEYLLSNKAPSARTILAGATIPEEAVAEAEQRGWVRGGSRVSLSGAANIPAGTRHRVVVVDDEDTKLLAVARLLRQDLKERGPDAPPARVMVYAQNEDTARRAAPALRKSLWGEHKMTALLPDGKEPLLALQAFRDNKTTLMLATPHHCRGLDLPAVSHVYNLEPPRSHSGYIHQAGRTNRVGFEGGALSWGLSLLPSLVPQRFPSPSPRSSAS